MVTEPENTMPGGIGVLFGDPIRHSFSPFLHNTVFNEVQPEWTFSLFESRDMDAFLEILKDPRCYGSAVTMPHKVAILKHMDELTPEGKDCGACNTVLIKKNKDGSRKYIGTNTDVIGIRESFYQNVSNPIPAFHGQPGMVIGGGGAARSAIYALRRMMHCKPVYLVNRFKEEVDDIIKECISRGYGQNLIHVETVEQAEKLHAPKAIVSCIPDFPPVTENEIQARKVVEVFLNTHEKGAFLEMCYHPSPWTEMGKIAEEAGWQVILGTEAMIYQGLEQQMLWTGKSLKELPVEKVKEVIAAKLKEAAE